MIGIEAVAAAMAESSLRAARPERRGGAPNALFFVAAAERVPDALCGIADELTVLFPWASLLRGALAFDADAASGLASLVRPGGRVEILVSITERDRSSAGVGPIDALDAVRTRDRWAAHGLDLETFELLSPVELAGIDSTWARRLDAARSRPVWRLVLRRRDRLAR